MVPTLWVPLELSALQTTPTATQITPTAAGRLVYQLARRLWSHSTRSRHRRTKTAWRSMTASPTNSSPHYLAFTVNHSRSPQKATRLISGLFQTAARIRKDFQPRTSKSVSNCSTCVHLARSSFFSWEKHTKQLS